MDDNLTRIQISCRLTSKMTKNNSVLPERAGFSTYAFWFYFFGYYYANAFTRGRIVTPTG